MGSARDALMVAAGKGAEKVRSGNATGYLRHARVTGNDRR